MSHETRKMTQLQQFMLFIANPLLPRAIRQEYMAQLRQVCLAAGDWLRQSIAIVLGGYKDQIVLASDALASVLILAGMTYCFWAASVPIVLALVLGAILTVLTLRGAYTYLFNIKGKRLSYQVKN